MKIRESFEYPAGPEAVFSLISDADFRKDATVSAGGKDVNVTVERKGDGTIVTITRRQPADLPDAIKKIAGDMVGIKQVEEWGAADAGGGRKAKVKMSVVGQPAGLEGTATLAPDGQRTSFTVSGEVKVSVPFIGKKFEPFIAKAVAASLRHDVKEGTKRL
jgi:hypothetical protein